MNNKKSPTQLALSLFPILGLSSEAYGATTVQIFTISPTGVIAEAFTSSVSIPPTELFRIDVDQFDPTVGTLSSVRIEIDLNVVGTANAGASGGFISADFDFDYLANGSDFYSSNSGGFADGNPDEPIVLNASFIRSVSFLMGDLDSVITTGTETFEFIVETDGQFLASGVDTDGAVLSHEGGTVSVTYDYTPVPEPGSLAFLLGSCGLFLSRRRK